MYCESVVYGPLSQPGVEIGLASIKRRRVRSGRLDLHQLAEGRGRINEHGIGAERHDPGVRRTNRGVEFIDPFGRVFDRASANTVRDVDQVHDRLAGRSGRDDRTSHREHKCRQQE